MLKGTVTEDLSTFTTPQYVEQSPALNIYQHSLSHSMLCRPATEDLSTFTTPQYFEQTHDPGFINIQNISVCLAGPWPMTDQHSLCHSMLSRPGTEYLSTFTMPQYAEWIQDLGFISIQYITLYWVVLRLKIYHVYHFTIFWVNLQPGFTNIHNVSQGPRTRIDQHSLRHSMQSGPAPNIYKHLPRRSMLREPAPKINQHLPRHSILSRGLHWTFINIHYAQYAMRAVTKDLSTFTTLQYS